MLLIKETIVKWNSANKKWFESKGYIYTKIGEEFKVKVEDLNKGSHSEVEILCDYCQKNILKIQYKDYISRRNKLKKDSCYECKGLKMVESNLNKYGLKSLTGTEEYNKKVHITNLKKYGHKYSSQSTEIKKKIKNTKIKQANDRIIRYDDYVEIILGNRSKYLVALIDLEDVDKVKDHKWRMLKNGYVSTQINKKIIYLHRLIMDCPEDMNVDHINHNKLNNKKYNLRICTIQENNRNHRLHKSNTSGINGVSWNNTSDCWCSFISVDNKTVYLGSSTNIDEAKKLKMKQKK